MCKPLIEHPPPSPFPQNSTVATYPLHHAARRRVVARQLRHAAIARRFLRFECPVNTGIHHGEVQTNNACRFRILQAATPVGCRVAPPLDHPLDGRKKIEVIGQPLELCKLLYAGGVSFPRDKVENLPEIVGVHEEALTGKEGMASATDE